MNVHFSSLGGHDIVKLHGELKVNLITEITPHLSKFIQANPGKDLILDLSDVDFIDSSTLRMLVNLHKRLEPDKKKVCLLSPTLSVRKIIEDVKLDTVFTMYASCEELEQQSTFSLRKAYGEFTKENGGLNKLTCTCPVCGSSEVDGYLIDENDYDWTWENDGLFPISMTKEEKKPIDVLSMLPIVCTSCYMSSLDFSHFHASNGEEHPAIEAALSESEKQQLSKAIKARKKMMESCVVIGDHFFNYPRQKIATYFCFRLSESCARSLATVKNASAPFWIGYINYLTIRYADQDMKEELIGNIRTWMTQVISEKESYKSIETAKAYFVLFAAAFSLGRHKDAIKALDDFSSFVKLLPSAVDAGSPGINNPAFWHAQALRIGERIAGSQA